MKFLSTTVATALVGGILATSAPANAGMADPGLRVPSAVENIACRVVRKQIRRPNGAVVFRTVQRCR